MAAILRWQHSMVLHRKCHDVQVSTYWGNCISSWAPRSEVTFLPNVVHLALSMHSRDNIMEPTHGATWWASGKTQVTTLRSATSSAAEPSSHPMTKESRDSKGCTYLVFWRVIDQSLWGKKKQWRISGQNLGILPLLVSKDVRQNVNIRWDHVS